MNETARARANVAAGQQDLLAVEQEVLLDATAAYMDVLRDREIVTLRQRNVEAPSEQLRGATARFDVGGAIRSASCRPTYCPAYRSRPSSAPATIRAPVF